MQGALVQDKGTLPHHQAKPPGVRTLQDIAHPQHHFFSAKRGFCHVVVRPRLQVLLLALRPGTRHHENGRYRCRPLPVRNRYRIPNAIVKYFFINYSY